MKFRICIENKNSLELKEIRFWKIYLVLTTFVTLGYLFGSLTNHPNRIEKFIYNEKVILDKYNEKFSQSRLEKLLLKLKVKHIDIVMAQSKIETGNYKSKVFLENNNLFGMRQSQQRVTTSTGTNLNHATYDSWQESVIDYAIYQSTYLKQYDRNQYLAYLQANYAESKDYVNLIKRITR